MDEWGYQELVIHPAPLNVFAIFLVPFIFKKSWMKKTSEFYAKIVFWFENIFFIIFFILYEFVLCPIIFFRVIFNIFKLAAWYMIFLLFLFWLVIGPFFLLGGIFIDSFYFIKILFDY